MGYQNALITGASSGLGRGLAVWFAKKGVTVYAAARRTAELEADDAVQRMAKAIERRDKSFLFPWPMAMAVRTLAALPNPLFEVAARKLR